MNAVIGFMTDMLPAALMAALVYAPLRLAFLRREQPVRNELFRLLLVMFCAGILAVTVIPEPQTEIFTAEVIRDPQYYNFRPFHAIEILKVMYNAGGFGSFLLINIVGNIVIFIPVGLMGCASGKGRIWGGTLTGFLLSCLIEALQVFIPRNTDIDDVIMNTLGALLGALLYKLAEKILRRKHNG